MWCLSGPDLPACRRLKMGYGDFRDDAARHAGRSGDGGIDGLINEDPLGLDVAPAGPDVSLSHTSVTLSSRLGPLSGTA